MSFESVMEQERIKAQQLAQLRAANNYNNQKSALDQKYENKGLGGFLGDLVGGIGKTIGDVGKGVGGLLGTAGASVGDIVNSIKDGKVTTEATNSFKRYWYGGEDDADAAAKAAGTSLNAATTLASTILPGAAAGTTAGKIAAGTAANTAAGALGGVADELQEQGKNASLEGATNRAISGAAAGLVTGGLNKKLGNATSKVGSALLNNKLATSAVGRGALSGALGGSVGAGTSAALAGQDIGSAALQGGLTGAMGGAAQGGIMSGTSKLARNMRDDIWADSSEGFGRRYHQYSGNPDGAIDYLMKRKKGEVPSAITSKAVGDITGNDRIDFVYGKTGKGGYGLAHIAEKHGLETLQKIPDILQNGSVVDHPRYTNEKRITLVSPDDNTSGVRLDWNGNKKQWVVSSFDGLPTGLKTSAPSANDNTITGDPTSRNTSGALGNSSVSQNTKNVNQQELSTSLPGQLRKKAAEKLLDQYGTIDKPMAKSADAINNVQKVADAGFEKPADVERMIGAITGDNGKVTKLTRQLVATAAPVNTFDGLDDLIENQITLAGLNGTDAAKYVRSIMKAQLNRLPSRREGSVTYTDNAEDVFDIVKSLEKRSANLKGKSGNNYSTTNPDRQDEAAVLDSIANVLKDRIYEGAAPMEQVLTPEVRQDLVNLAPKNEKWVNYVDNTIMKSRDIGELRNTVAPFVNMGKLIENQYMNYGTYGQRVGDSAKEAGKFAKALFKVPIAGQIAEGVANSNIAKRVMSKGYSKAADIAANQPKVMEAEIVPNQGLQNMTSAQATSQPNNLNILGNFIGRTTGLQKADNNMTNLQKAQDYKNLEDMFADVANYGSGNSEVMSLDGLGGTGYGYGPQTGATSQLASQMNEIAGAMTNALAAGDINAYSQLADMYSTAYKIYQAQAEMSGLGSSSTAGTSNIKLSKTQQQANAAALALDQLEGMNPDFGYTVSDIPLLNLVNIGGNNYDSTAKSLAMNIGYMLSGANIKQDEAEAIGKAYVPQPFDNDATRQYKLQQARKIIQQYQNTYTTDANNNY